MRSYEDLMRMAKAFAGNNMVVKDTADSMMVTRGTVTYHLKKIKQITGLDPFDFYDLYKIVTSPDLMSLTMYDPNAPWYFANSS